MDEWLNELSGVREILPYSRISTNKYRRNHKVRKSFFGNYHHHHIQCKQRILKLEDRGQVIYGVSKYLSKKYLWMTGAQITL